MTVEAASAFVTASSMLSRIYLVTNKLNNKQYVGQTITMHSRHGHGHAIKTAYKKYGHSNFDYFTIIQGDFTENQLNFFEKFWICVYDTLTPNGYNLEEGGRRGKIVHHSPNKGKRASETTRAKMSISQKKRSKEIAALNALRTVSQETRLKMSIARTGRIQPPEERLKRSEAIKLWHQSRKRKLNE